MRPSQVNERNFDTYPPLAKQFAIERLELIRDLPIVLSAVLLREVIRFDSCFPQERAAIQGRFTFLGSLNEDERRHLTQSFADLKLPDELVAEDWVRSPEKFGEDLSAYLWASHQIDAFHTMSNQLLHAVSAATPASKPPAPRWGAVILGPQLSKQNYPLFRKLRPHGVFFPVVNGDGGSTAILDRLAKRAVATPAPYGHWYIDGGKPLPGEYAGVSTFSWDGSSQTRDAVLRKVQSVVGSGSGGPEMLRSVMADWTPKEPGSPASDPLVDRFVQSVYDEGAGTQIFSTTFVQWSARELLRRADPVSLVARFGPRQRQRPMNEMFAAPAQDMDYAGSAVDADLGAYYTWVNLNRLPGSETASFVAWSEDQRQAVAIGPGFPRGTEAGAPVTMEKLLDIIARS